ncbi:penicillin acylase family protein [Hyphobacterium sp. HN65]|uniref:Penicillin acylase family protein n=1 Tax=Hyphobacterium lacteum TaxID=3116575 RepID=A0ABU7LNY0_9PROT|nr:penicillin acylase family protein [Hyphobacterium sp. HN65]MEE2525597.1 penicillin acylase family protein [Hyphobacterium sp. HN65]
MGWVIRGLAAILGLVILLVAGATGFVYYRFSSSMPRTEGTVEVAGLSADVQIIRDEYGVPHIFGETDEDIYFGIGYAHAQDRLFQMDLMRRYVHGELADLLGHLNPATARADARSRNRGYHLVADAAVENAGPEIRRAMEAYARGVNARMAEGHYPPEYLFLQTSPEPWELEDSAAVVVYMADSLAAGEYAEVANRELANLLSPEQYAQFLPGYPDWAPTMLQEEDFPPLEEPAPPTTEAQPDYDDGSNAWVLSGEHTASGQPLLANDPHLALGAPGIWYFARLHLPQGAVVGATIAGSPLVVLGRNQVSAWGFTNTGFDVIDMVPYSPGTMATVERTETIEVRGGDDLVLTFRDAEDGPVLDPDYFDLDVFGEQDVVLVSTALNRQNRVADVSLRLMLSQNFEEFVEAGRGFTAPMQNMHYANVDGTIGYTTPGLLPIRDEYGNWTGFVPYEELPRVENPVSGRIASGNNRITPDNYPYDTPGTYAAYRAERIDQRLNALDVHTPESFHDIQMDHVSALITRILPALQAAEPQTDLGRRALVLIQNWDGDMDALRAEPLIYALWYRDIAEAIYGDDLGDEFERHLSDRRVFTENVLIGGKDDWCDDINTDTVETCPQQLGSALDAAMIRGVERFGPDIDNWTWGSAHQAVFDHPVFTGSGLPLLDDWYTVRQPIGGDGSTVNVAVYSVRAGSFDVFHGPSLRAVYDLADLESSRFMHAPGQSGHPWSDHYRDLAPLWAAGESFEMRTDWGPEDAPEGVRVLTLTPAN